MRALEKEKKQKKSLASTSSQAPVNGSFGGSSSVRSNQSRLLKAHGSAASFGMKPKHMPNEKASSATYKAGFNSTEGRRKFGINSQSL
jgi:hypothetical protein